MYLYLAIALLSASLSGFGVWKVQDWRHDAQEKERMEQANELRRINAKTSDTSSASYEKGKTSETIRYQTIFESVEKIIDRPVYRDTLCWDDPGLRALDAALSRDSAAPGQSAGAVPRPTQTK